MAGLVSLAAIAAIAAITVVRSNTTICTGGYHSDANGLAAAALFYLQEHSDSDCPTTSRALVRDGIISGINASPTLGAIRTRSSALQLLSG